VIAATVGGRARVGLGTDPALHPIASAVNTVLIRTVSARRAMFPTMNRLVIAIVVLVSWIGVATAEPKAAPKSGQALGTALPNPGETLSVDGAPGWPPKLEWLYDSPSLGDSAGKVVIFWFCAPRVAACVDDLARIVTLRENARVYVIAYINGGQGDAKKLDPIRAEEGVGHGTTAFGRNVTSIMKQMSIVGPASIVVDVDNKIALVTTGSSPAELDARDAKVNALATNIKEYTTTNAGPTLVKPDDKFNLNITIKLAPWLKYTQKTPSEFRLTAPKDIKCDQTVLKAAQLKITDQTMTAQVTCSGPKGTYELRGTVTFGYQAPGGSTGMGTESANWKFDIKQTGL